MIPCIVTFKRITPTALSKMAPQRYAPIALIDARRQSYDVGPRLPEVAKSSLDGQPMSHAVAIARRHRGRAGWKVSL